MCIVLLDYAFDQNTNTIYRCRDSVGLNYCKAKSDREVLSRNAISLDFFWQTQPDNTVQSGSLGV
ncbi:MAG: hypothetical protein NC904_08520, partial [Candidatus Omnitrophica bacterium]|nr:hypothetical protein [Candidatus Omnitrophota bacterium]